MARPEVASSEIWLEQQRQSLFVLEEREREMTRVYDIGERLLLVNAELCPRRGWTLGLTAENLNDYGRSFRRAARDLWDLDEDPRIAWVAAGGPAERAGVRVGDRVLAVNGAPIPEERRAGRTTRGMLRDAADDGRVTLEVQRGGEVLELDVDPQESCGYTLHVVDDDALNAGADGRTIVLHRGMMRFARSDEELALILGHELAHNAMRHRAAKERNELLGAAGGAMIDLLAGAAGLYTGGAFEDVGREFGAMAYSQDFESEADYVGMYFMRRAGFDIDDVEAFWRRMAVEHPETIRLADTHPTTAERFLVLARTREEIRVKEASGEPLVPNARRHTARRSQ